MSPILAAIAAIMIALPAAAQQRATAGLQVPVEYHKLDNGLRVVLSPDRTSPIATVAVYYNVGFRLEPRNRTGFAHLFEHLMFEGSPNIPDGAFQHLIQGNGGVLNGSTRFDFTNYYEIVPAHTVETVLWAEADRMRGIQATAENLKNQQDVVKNEVKVNVMNQPYGGFPWLDLPQKAFTNWPNAHNFYGDFTDLDSATVEEAQGFFTQYYSPGNAVLVVTGDIEPAATLAMVRKYFAGIPAAPPPPPPDVSEPRQEAEKRFTKVDSLATKPAIAIGYMAPPRNSPEYYAMGLLDQILLQGEDSRLHQALVQRRGITGQVGGGINADLGNMFDYDGPMLWSASLIHDADKTPDQILAVVDSVVAGLQAKPIDRATLDRALVKMRSSLYGSADRFFGFGRANLLASFALFDDDPARINTLETEFRKVTPAMIQKTAREYLRTAARTVLIVEPKGDARGVQP